MPLQAASTAPPATSGWDDGDPRIAAALARVQAHPDFAPAVQALASSMLDLFDSERALAGIFKDAGRYVAAMVAASMARDGVSLPDLKRLCAAFGLLSPGRAHAMLAYLAWLGLITPWPGNGRSHAVAPAFQQAWRQHLVAALQAAALIDPKAATMASRLAQPEWLHRFTSCQMQGLLQSRPDLDGAADLARVFLERDAGSPLLWLMISESGWQPSGGQAFPLNGAALARRFGVSRMHIARLLAAARSSNLLIEDGTGHQFTVSANQEIAHLYGLQLARLLVSCEHALAG